MEVNVHFNVDIVSSDDSLPANGDYLDFDVYDAERLGADVDLDQAWVNGLVELTEARDESHGAYKREQTRDEQRTILL
jgi:hypothetical protein